MSLAWRCTLHIRLLSLAMAVTEAAYPALRSQSFREERRMTSNVNFEVVSSQGSAPMPATATTTALASTTTTPSTSLAPTVCIAARDCSGHGYCKAGGGCVCKRGDFGVWLGSDCSQCYAGYAGPFCNTTAAAVAKCTPTDAPGVDGEAVSTPVSISLLDGISVRRLQAAVAMAVEVNPCRLVVTRRRSCPPAYWDDDGTTIADVVMSGSTDVQQKKDAAMDVEQCASRCVASERPCAAFELTWAGSCKLYARVTASGGGASGSSGGLCVLSGEYVAFGGSVCGKGYEDITLARECSLAARGLMVAGLTGCYTDRLLTARFCRRVAFEARAAHVATCLLSSGTVVPSVRSSPDTPATCRRRCRLDAGCLAASFDVSTGVCTRCPAQTLAGVVPLIGHNYSSLLAYIRIYSSGSGGAVRPWVTANYDVRVHPRTSSQIGETSAANIAAQLVWSLTQTSGKLQQNIEASLNREAQWANYSGRAAAWATTRTTTTSPDLGNVSTTPPEARNITFFNLSLAGRAEEASVVAARNVDKVSPFILLAIPGILGIAVACGAAVFFDKLCRGRCGRQSKQAQKQKAHASPSSVVPTPPQGQLALKDSGGGVMSIMPAEYGDELALQDQAPRGTNALAIQDTCRSGNERLPGQPEAKDVY